MTHEACVMTDKRVAIFWDLENCRTFSGIPGQKIITNIRNAAHAYGRITSFRAYIEVTLLDASLRSLFQSSGVSIIDCPHNGRKEVADQMMLVDVMAYAMDNDPPSTIILITGDRDFAYLVSTLTLRQYHVIVIVPPNHHSSLTYQASAVLDWNTQIIQQPSKSTSAGLSDSVPPSPPQPFSFPNTFPVSSSKQAEEPSESVGAYDLSQLATAVPTLTKKQKRLLKKQSTTALGTTSSFGVITSTSDAQANGNILQWGASSAAAPFQSTLDPLAPAFQRSSTSTLAIPSEQLKTYDGTKPTRNVPFFPFSEKDVNSNITLKYQSITAMPEYSELSIEELRVDDYREGRTVAFVNTKS